MLSLLSAARAFLILASLRSSLHGKERHLYKLISSRSMTYIYRYIDTDKVDVGLTR